MTTTQLQHEALPARHGDPLAVRQVDIHGVIESDPSPRETLVVRDGQHVACVVNRHGMGPYTAALLPPSDGVTGEWEWLGSLGCTRAELDATPGLYLHAADLAPLIANHLHSHRIIRATVRDLTTGAVMAVHDFDPHLTGGRIEHDLAAADDDLVTCRTCSTELPSDTTCAYSDDGAHLPDMQLHAVPEDEPHRLVRLDLVIRVPNDGYDYRTDVAGRLERIASRMLTDRLVTQVTTRGPTGSGCAETAPDAHGHHEPPHPSARVVDGQLLCGHPGCDQDATRLSEDGYTRDWHLDIDGTTITARSQSGSAAFSADGDGTYYLTCSAGHENTPPFTAWDWD